MYADLRAFIDDLDRLGQLARVKTQVDPHQEISIIHHRVIAAGGPALLFDRCHRIRDLRLDGVEQRGPTDPDLTPGVSWLNQGL